VPGTYILVLEVIENIIICVNRLQWELKPGIYLYFGSAKGKTSNSLKNRINRHFNNKKKFFWHIDYLTIHSSVILRCVYLKTDEHSNECTNLSNISNDISLEIITRFGSSDCKKECGGHLGYIENNLISIKWLDDYFEGQEWTKFQKKRQ